MLGKFETTDFQQFVSTSLQLKLPKSTYPVCLVITFPLIVSNAPKLYKGLFITFCCAVLIGLSISLVLSTLPKPIFSFEIETLPVL